MELPIAHLQRTTSEQAVQLTADQKAVLLKQLETTSLMLKTLYQQLHTDSLTDGFTVTSLGLLEQQIRDLSKATGVPCESAAELEERTARMRAANRRVRELESQIGTQAAQADVSLGVRAISEAFRRWWKVRGFGHASNVRFDDYGNLHAELSGNLFPPGRLMSVTPVTDELNAAQWFQSLKDRGFQIGTKGYGDEGVIDCPETRAALAALFSEIPSLLICEVRTACNKENKFKLRQIDVLVREPRQVLDIAPKGGDL
ncbi:hypothetical protein ACOTHJ_12615 [Achromobacter xylosoxidans]